MIVQEIESNPRNLVGVFSPDEFKNKTVAFSSHATMALTQESRAEGNDMKIKVILHDAEEGGYWASVPSLPGCFSQGDTLEETLANIREAIECYLDAPEVTAPETGRVEEVEV